MKIVLILKKPMDKNQKKYDFKKKKIDDEKSSKYTKEVR